MRVVTAVIEANPTNFARLQQSGRNATMVHAAVCVGIPSITMTMQGGPAAGDVSGFSKKQKRLFDVNQVRLRTARLMRALCARASVLARGLCPPSGCVPLLSFAPPPTFCLHRHTQTVVVPCKSLTQIMAEAGHPTANFLSLDVEGAEDKVLKAARPDAFDLVRERIRARRTSPLTAPSPRRASPRRASPLRASSPRACPRHGSPRCPKSFCCNRSL